LTTVSRSRRLSCLHTDENLLIFWPAIIAESKLSRHFSRYRLALAILVRKAHIRVNLIPERVGLANSRELFKNGATAKKSLPKNTSQKCNRTPARDIY
jgi:hypothetical protein